MINSANYLGGGQVLKYSYTFNKDRLNKNLYKSLLKITTNNQQDEFKRLLVQATTGDIDMEIINNIVIIPEEYHYYEDSIAIAKTHLLEIYEQDESLSVTDRQAYRDLVLQYLYAIYNGSPTPYDDYFYKTDDMNVLLSNTLEYLKEKKLAIFDESANRYKITAKGIDEYEEQYLLSI